MKEYIVKEDCPECNGQGSWDLSRGYEYKNCESCEGSGDVEVTLTEFFVTEKYIVKAKTVDDVDEMIAADCFDGNFIKMVNIKIQPNF